MDSDTLAQPPLPFLGDPATTCPWCGTEEANVWQLQNNHWVRPADWTGYDWARANQMCVAQHLTSNHVRYYARALRDRDAFATTGRKNGKFNEADALENLQRAISRARSLGVNTDALLAETEAAA